MPQAVLHGESPRQRSEAVDRDIFGARHWAQFRCREEGGDIGAERSQALTQHLAPPTERSLGNGFKELAIARRRSGERCETHQRGRDPRRRHKWSNSQSAAYRRRSIEHWRTGDTVSASWAPPVPANRAAIASIPVSPAGQLSRNAQCASARHVNFSG